VVPLWVCASPTVQLGCLAGAWLVPAAGGGDRLLVIKLTIGVVDNNRDYTKDVAAHGSCIRRTVVRRAEGEVARRGGYYDGYDVVPSSNDERDAFGPSDS
jgi:hypothetical protein